jgi:2-hydroxycyclohexanecarboxyl-CoA dehydrogenase
MSSEPERVPPAPFNESVGLIVGGTAGVGLAAARQLAEAGMSVLVLVGRNRERGEAAAAAVRSVAATEVIFLAADSGEPAQVQGVVDTVIERFGRIDLCVNSTASNHTPRLLHEIAIADIGAILADQALPPLYMSRAVLEPMRRQGRGVILNVASDAAKSPTPGESVIGAAMAAITMFSRTMAVEAKRDGVRVNVLTPSLIANTLTYDMLSADPFSARLFGKAAKLASLGVAEPEDLAALIVFLASPAAAKLTGQAISVNGGISAA